VCSFFSLSMRSIESTLVNMPQEILQLITSWIAMNLSEIEVPRRGICVKKMVCICWSYLHGEATIPNIIRTSHVKVAKASHIPRE
jgi:hypothetical protein